MKIIYEIDKSGFWQLNAYVHVRTAVEMNELSKKIEIHTEYVTQFDDWREKMEDEKVFTNLGYERFQGSESIIFKFYMKLEDTRRAIEEFQKYMTDKDFFGYDVVSKIVDISKLNIN